jgi:methylmalonic aciduria homocystinuria type C protein
MDAPPTPWPSLTKSVAARLAASGLDLVHPFSVDWYNARAAPRGARLPDFGRSGALGLLIGNTQALWPHFRRAYAAEPRLQTACDPLDAYCTDAVLACAAAFEAASVVRFAHELEPAPIPIQRIAAITGFATLSPSHLSVHAEQGPWIALRAVAIFDVDGPSGDPPPHRDLCTPCHKPCMPAFNSAFERLGGELAAAAVELDWQSWLAVRDACPVGKSSRYSDEQIRYHYTKRRSLLES